MRVSIATKEPPSWRLIDEVGGEEALERLVRDFYTRLFDDTMVGFFFWPHDKEALIAHQMAYVRAHVGAPDGTSYRGRSMRRAHEHLPILVGHFDRRHQILEEVLRDHAIVSHVAQAWLALDESLRTFIVRTGAKKRRAILEGEEE